jgi:arylsulfatase A-like enzyme
MPRPPNILWIVTTQWRAQAFGYAGDPNARTPHLDRLAAESANFSQAVTPHPFGPFARAALLTGRWSPENGVRDYYDPLPVDARTIAHAMRARGYDTAFFGKWHLWRRDPKAALVGEEHARIVVPPEARGGFEFWEGFESGHLLNDPWLHGTELPVPTRFAGYQSTVIGQRFAEWRARRRAAKPSFAVISLEAPHPPYDAPANGVRPRRPEEIILPANVPHGTEIETKARRELAGYHAHIEATDLALAEVLASADRETVVVFTSVHGDMHGAHGLFRKGWPYEGNVRVPLLIRGPGIVPGDDPAPVSLVNLSEMMSRAIEGSSLTKGLPSFAKISMPSIVRLPLQCDRAWRGVRTPTRKLVFSDPASTAGETARPWLYFDLERDPLEQCNLAGDPARVEEIERLRHLAGI